MFDSMYYNQLEDTITGYKKVKIKDYINYISRHWCKLTTITVKKMKESYHQPCGTAKHITKFAKRLDSDKKDLRSNIVLISNAGKLHFFIGKMYAAISTFERNKMIMWMWEDTGEANKKWTNIKQLFSKLVNGLETYNKDNHGGTTK